MSEAKRMTAEQQTCLNTDRELWRRVAGDYYSPRLWLVEHNGKDGIGMDVGGHCIVMPIEMWHALAAPVPGSAIEQAYAKGRLDQFVRMKNERPADPIYWDMHEEKAIKEACVSVGAVVEAGSAEGERGITLPIEVGDILVGCANLLDTIKGEWGEAWSEWDQSMRDGITKYLKLIYEQTDDAPLNSHLGERGQEGAKPDVCRICSKPVDTGNSMVIYRLLPKPILREKIGYEHLTCHAPAVEAAATAPTKETHEED